MTTFPPVAENGDPHVEGNNTWIYQDGAWLKQSPEVSTENVTLADPTNPADTLTAYPQALPEIPDIMGSQYDVNRWFVDALTSLDTRFEDGDFIAGISVGEDPPDNAVNGTLWFDSSDDSLTLFLYYNPNEDGNGIWIPAAPPISAIEEINALLGTLGDDLDLVEERVYDLNSIGLQPPISPQDGYIWKNQNPEENRAFIYDGVGPGAKWELLSQVTRINDNPPPNPVEGDLWYDPTTTKVLSVYSGGQWNQVSIGEDGLARIEDIEADQATQDGRLDTLENKVTALEGGIFDANWSFEDDVTNPRAGEFTLINSGAVTTDFTAAQSIVISTQDNDGNTYSFDKVTVNDVIRISSLDGGVTSTVEYKITSVITPGAYQIDYITGSGTAVDETVYGFLFLQQFDPTGLATINYVDQQDELKVSKSGDTVKGVLTVSSENNANDDGVRFYMKDNTGAINLTMFPSGVLTGKNVIRVNKDSGDCFQIRDASGGAVKYKVDAEGRIEARRLKLTGGNTAASGERNIDAQNGVAGRLTYNDKTRLSWGNNKIYIGTSDNASLGEASEAISLDLQGNKIENVSELKIELGGSNGKKFTIKGELQDGTVSEDWFYSYKNSDGTPDAMNYNGKMDSNANLVNKKYVDDAIGSISTDSFMPKNGGTFTGLVSFNRPGNNQQISFLKSGNNDIWYNGKWIISLQGDDNPKVKLATSMDMNSKQITNLGAPTASNHAVTKGSLQGIKVVQTSSGSGGTESGGFYYSSGRLFYKV